MDEQAVENTMVQIVISGSDALVGIYYTTVDKVITNVDLGLINLTFPD